MAAARPSSDTVPSGDLLATLVRRRYVVLGGFALAFWIYRLADGATAAGDWNSFVHLARHLGSFKAVGVYAGPIAVFAAMPLGWASATTSWIVWSAVCMTLGVVSIRNVEQAAATAGLGEPRTREWAVLLGGIFLLYVWSYPGVVNGHLDDVLALTAITVALRAVAADRWLLASVAIAFALASKPWAILVLPLAAAQPGARVKGVAVAVGLAVLPALPFVIAHHGNLDVARLNLGTAHDSVLRYLGVREGSRPSWARELQVAVAWPLGAWSLWRGRWWMVPLLALAVRVNLDPQTSTYYLAGPFLGLFVWDVVSTRLAGLRTSLTCVVLLIVPVDLGLYQASGIWVADTQVIIRLLIAVVPIMLLVAAELRRTRPLHTGPLVPPTSGGPSRRERATPAPHRRRDDDPGSRSTR